MLPSQFKRLYDSLRSLGETLRAEFHGAVEVIQQQESAVKDASQTREQKQAEIGATIAAAIKTAADSVPDYEKTQRHKEHALQKALFWVTLAGTVAAVTAASGAIYYAAIAKETYGEIQRQTAAAICAANAAQNAAIAAQEQATLMRQQLIGTQAAVLQMSFQVIPAGEIEVALAPSGVVKAKDVHVVFSATREHISPERPFGETVTYSKSVPFVGPLIWSDHEILPWHFPDISRSDGEWPDKWPGNETVRIEGKTTYDNGFGDKEIATECIKWLPHYTIKTANGAVQGGGFTSCTAFDETVRTVLKKKENEKIWNK
jgi:hypothetical protein